MAKKKWPPPGFPLVSGDYALTDTWSIHLPEKFARRVEDGDLVLWRPGLTIWLADWNNDKGKSQAKRLKWIKKEASPKRYAESESKAGNLTRFSYRLREENEDGPVESVSAFILNDDGHLQIAVYFDDPDDEATARALVDSIVARERETYRCPVAACTGWVTFVEDADEKPFWGCGECGSMWFKLAKFLKEIDQIIGRYPYRKACYHKVGGKWQPANFKKEPSDYERRVEGEEDDESEDFVRG